MSICIFECKYNQVFNLEKKLSFKSNHLIFHLIWDFEDFWPDMTSYFMYLVICPALYVNFLWICHVNVLESGSLPFIGISWPCFASICPPPTLHTLVQYWKTRTISATYQRVFQNFTSVRTTVPRYFLAVKYRVNYAALWYYKRS